MAPMTYERALYLWGCALENLVSAQDRLISAYRAMDTRREAPAVDAVIEARDRVKKAEDKMTAVVERDARE